MRLLQLLCVHLLSPVLAQRGLVVNKRARQRLSRSEVSENRGRRGGETVHTSDQFAPLPNFEFNSENDDVARRKTSYELPVWDNPAKGYRRRRKLETRSRHNFDTFQDQEISDGYSTRERQGGRTRAYNGERLRSTDDRYSFREGTHPQFNDEWQPTQQPWTIDYDPKKLPSGNKFSEPQRSWEEFNAEDSYEPRRLSFQEDFSYSQKIDIPSPQELQYASVSRPKQIQGNNFQEVQPRQENYDNVYTSEQDFQLAPEDFQFKPQEEFSYRDYHEYDSPERFIEPNVFEPSLEIQTKAPFLPTPLPNSEFYYPNNTGDDYIEISKFFQTTKIPVPETTYWTPPAIRKQEVEPRYTTATTDASYWYQETTTEYRKPTTTKPRSRSRSRALIRKNPSVQIDHNKNKVQTKSFRRRIPRRRVVKRVKENRNFDPRGQTGNTFQSRLGIADENSSKNTRGRSRFISRSRSRINSFEDKPIELDRPVLSHDPKLSRAIERLNKHIDEKIQQTRQPIDTNTNRLPTKIENNRLPPRKSTKAKHSPSSPSIKFPKKNLFPHLPKVKYAASKSTDDDIDNNTIDSGRLPKSISSKGSFIPIQDIQPTRPIPKPEFKKPEYDYDYESIEIQSSRDDDDDGFITVTHQAKVPTVYTILEGKETKQLHAVVKTTSLQIVDVNDLTSTEIDGVGIVYAHVITNHPQFGVKEFKFDKIEPTTTQHILSSPITIAGHKTMFTETVKSTFYNVQTITARITETPSLDTKAAATSGLEDLVKTIIAGLLGNNILNNNIIDDVPATPYTKFKTHTRSYLTETSSTKTMVIPITLRGQQVMKTVTDIITDTITTTDYSIQTFIDYIKPSTPFLPLAPTLHRAARVIPSLPTINPLNIQPVSTTQYLTQAVVTTATLTEDATTPVIITLGGREVQTSFVQPTTQIVTVTSYSTQTLIQPVVATRSPSNNLANILRSLKFLQNLRQK